MFRLRFAVAATATMLSGLALAQAPTPAPLACSPATPVVTSHVAQIDGKAVAYDATAGFLHVTAADNKSQACVFYTAYHRTDLPAATSRPLAFAFNGGPGSASLWLHLGALGPKRPDLGPDGLHPVQPVSMLDNESSFLDLMDLVMIDPVATGYSTADAGSSPDQFFGVKNDYQSIAAFVQQYLTQANRWDSPKFVIGESYGGVRGALLTNYLQRSLGININGIIFVSPWLSTITTNFSDPGNDLAYVSFLPTFATTAWYHGKLGGKMAGKSLADTRAAAEAFAFGPYLEALSQGSDLPAAQLSAVAQQIADLSGLPVAYVLEKNLRISDSDFFQSLMATERQITGRYDSRFVEGATGVLAEDYNDPAEQALSPTFTAGINDYLINDLNWRDLNPYITSGQIDKWPEGTEGSEFGVMDELSAAMMDNPQLQIYVAAGYYDLAVPFGATKYNFRHLTPGQGLEERVTFGFFEAGHMVYTNPVSLTALKADIRTFVAKALAPVASAPVPVSH